MLVPYNTLWQLVVSVPMDTVIVLEDREVGDDHDWNNWPKYWPFLKVSYL